MSRALEAIRKTAYEQGYQDGRRKQRKLSEFWNNWNPKEIGW